jgi:DNA-directed RNA polymerase subunit D
MNIKILKKSEDKVVYEISDTEVHLVNALRRLVMEEVPAMAIEEVTFNKNTSALYDEMIAHRMGLLSITTDLSSYNLKEDCKCKRKGCSRCQLKMTLQTKGPCTVYAKDIVSKDSKVKPAHQDSVLALLLKGQVLELEALASLGRGKDHSKYSPGLAFYIEKPALKTTKDSNLKKATEESKNLVLKGNKLEIKDLTAWNDADEQICENNKIAIEHSKKDFIFTLESWGQLDLKKLPGLALNIMEDKLKELNKQIK